MNVGDLVKANGEHGELVSGPWSGGGLEEPYIRFFPTWYSGAEVKRVPLRCVRVLKTAEERVAKELMQ